VKRTRLNSKPSPRRSDPALQRAAGDTIESAERGRAPCRRVQQWSVSSSVSNGYARNRLVAAQETQKVLFDAADAFLGSRPNPRWVVSAFRRKNDSSVSCSGRGMLKPRGEIKGRCSCEGRGQGKQASTSGFCFAAEGQRLTWLSRLSQLQAGDRPRAVGGEQPHWAEGRGARTISVFSIHVPTILSRTSDSLRMRSRPSLDTYEGSSVPEYLKLS
jgi:hypothetical protein